MTAKPWTDQTKPGDFDADLTERDPLYVEHHAGDDAARLIGLGDVEGEDARRLERVSEARGKERGGCRCCRGP